MNVIEDTIINKPIKLDIPTHTKITEIEKILKKQGKFIIVSDYSETFDKIQKLLISIKLTYMTLKGHSTTINNTINSFEAGDINVLMLNSQYFGAGLNLQMTTDLILYHKFSKSMEEQVIGRAQRYGRTCPLNIHHIMYENELV